MKWKEWRRGLNKWPLHSLLLPIAVSSEKFLVGIIAWQCEAIYPGFACRSRRLQSTLGGKFCAGAQDCCSLSLGLWHFVLDNSETTQWIYIHFLLLFFFKGRFQKCIFCSSLPPNMYFSLKWIKLKGWVWSPHPWFLWQQMEFLPRLPA